MKKSTNTRKSDHIDLALQAQVAKGEGDKRFDYEPLLPPALQYTGSQVFETMKFPLWISSMTGGVDKGKNININLAKGAKKYGLAMGLGSCRVLLDHRSDRFEDFDMRSYIGDQPLYANLGIAQIKQLLETQKMNLVREVVNRLQADGLIIHLNPLQEIFQPEGDDVHFDFYPVLRTALDHFNFPVIVKEVGQGMGTYTLSKLMELPLKAIETASLGGTNFTLLEQMRSQSKNRDGFEGFVHVGHSAFEMVDKINQILMEQPNIECKNVIISGGIQHFLDGYYLVNKVNANAVYGQASALMKRAQVSFEELDLYLNNQIQGYRIAERYLRVNN